MSTAGLSTKNEEEAAVPVRAGELLFCGGTAWDVIGRKTSGPDVGGAMLLSPTRLRPLMGVPIVYVASGSVSCHCVAIDVDGRCFTWGRNERGQLGHGDILNRDAPTVVAALTDHKILKAGAGRHFTVVSTSNGDSFTFGCNKHGQLGSGSVKNEIESVPVKALVSNVTHVCCGAEFTVWLTDIPGATILTAGLPQYGQLGHGTDNQYNAKDSSVRLVYEPQPRPKAIAAFSEKMVTKIACGNNHTVAVDSSGFVYTWGFGGYGRLGHREQKDEWVPRMVEFFQRHLVLPPTSVVAAGSTFSACTSSGGQLYMWGRVKATGDSWMYPKPVIDLSGWAIRCMDCGEKISFVGAEKSCISWGQSFYGELGYGRTGPKSSASPKKVDLLEGMEVVSVACGVGHSLILVDRTGVEDKIEKLEMYECSAPIQALSPAKEKKMPPKHSEKKRKTAGETSEDDKQDADDKTLKAQNGDKKQEKTATKIADQKRPQGRLPSQKAVEASDDDDGDNSDDDDSKEEESDQEVEGNEQDDEAKPKMRGRGRGRGQGRGSGRGSSIPQEKEVEPTQSKRGRGRPRRS